MHTSTVTFLNLDFDNLALDEVKAGLAQVSPESPYGYIVTPNVDHLVKLESQPQLRSIYEDAALCVCDSRVLAFLARLQGRRLNVVPGSDLTESLFADVIRPGDRIAIVGGDGRLIERLRSRYAGVDFVHHVPPMGLDRDKKARRAAAAFIASANARFTLIAVGSPQQEIIAREALSMGPSGGVALCIGASLDFLTGRQKRAPRFVRKLGLEWAHRLVTNPRRLWRRYLVDGLKIFPIYVRHSRRSLAGFAVGALVILSLGAGAIYGLFARDWMPSDAPSKDDEIRVADTMDLKLPAPDLLRPLSPEEAAKVNVERPFARRPDQAAASFGLNTKAADRLKAETCLAQAIYYEAAAEGPDGGRAVAQVVLNRVRHPAYPASICGVVYQGAERTTGCQFSFTCDGSLQRPPGASGWTIARRLAEEALAGRVFAPVGHATHFHANYVLPYWADSLDKSVQIGRHIFYRLRGTLGARGTFAQRYAGAEPTITMKPNLPLAVLPTEVDQLLDGLLADDISPESRAALAPLNPNIIAPTSRLIADGDAGTLIADANREVRATTAPRLQPECVSARNDRQLRPMKPESLAAGIDGKC